MFRINLCLIFLISIFLFSGCSNKAVKIFPSDDFTKEARSKYEASFAELERNRQLWQENKIENYDFETEYHTGTWLSTFPSAAIKVREGKLVSLEKIQKDNPTEFSDYQERATTVENIFDFIKQELDNDRKVNVKYNQKTGYPEQIDITFSSAIDASGVFIIEKFEIVK